MNSWILDLFWKNQVKFFCRGLSTGGGVLKILHFVKVRMSGFFSRWSMRASFIWPNISLYDQAFFWWRGEGHDGRLLDGVEQSEVLCVVFIPCFASSKCFALSKRSNSLCCEDQTGRLNFCTTLNVLRILRFNVTLGCVRTLNSGHQARYGVRSRTTEFAPVTSTTFSGCHGQDLTSYEDWWHKCQQSSRLRKSISVVCSNKKRMQIPDILRNAVLSVVTGTNQSFWSGHKWFYEHFKTIYFALRHPE